MGKSTTKYLALLCALALVVSLGGVFATWYYSVGIPDPYEEDMGIDITQFVWKPEEVLPTETPGQNYMDLLGSILENDKAGLNSSKDVLEKAVLKDKLVHSAQSVQGGNLKHLFTTEESRELEFLVEYVTDEEFHVYMYDEIAVDAGTVNETQIKVFKTIMVVENGEWVAREAQVGYATLRYARDYSYIAIRPAEWIQGSMPA